MSKYITMGIDASLRFTGISIILPGDPYQCVIETDDLRDGLRLEYIYKRLEMVIAKFSPQLILVEDYNYKGHNLAQIGEVIGIVKLACSMPRINCLMVTPAGVKKFATGCSQAKKARMMTRYDLDNEHIADAHALANIGQLFLGATSSTTRYELEVVRDLKKKKSKKVQRTRIANLAKLPVAV